MVDTKVDTQWWSSKSSLYVGSNVLSVNLDDQCCVSTLVSTVIYINKVTCLLQRSLLYIGSKVLHVYLDEQRCLSTLASTVMY